MRLGKNIICINFQTCLTHRVNYMCTVVWARPSKVHALLNVLNYIQEEQKIAVKNWTGKRAFSGLVCFELAIRFCNFVYAVLSMTLYLQKI